MIRRGFLTLLALIGIVAFAALGCFLSWLSFSRLQQMRELERVPRTEVLAALTGEINLAGRVEFIETQALLSSPRTQSACVYYRYVVERKKRDSEGKTRWDTEIDVTRFVPFLLRDETGAIVLEPTNAVNFSVEQDYHVTVGDLRYTEYRLDAGDPLFCFGYAVRGADDTIEVRFDQKGRYTPIIAQHSELEERMDMATGSVFACWGGLSAISFAVVLLCVVVRVHKIIVYLILVTIVLGGGLIHYGMSMMHDDLTAGRDRLNEHTNQAAAEFHRIFDATTIEWASNDWAAVGSLDDPRYETLDPLQRQRLSRIRLDLARATARTNEIQNRFPERLFAAGWGLSDAPAIPLPTADLALLADLDRDFLPATVPDWVLYVFAPIGLLMGLGFTRWGFRRIRHKRYIENLPTSPTAGVAWGPAEVVGKVEKADAEPLMGPLSQLPCVQYRYHVQERRTSGKNSKWVTIEDRKETQPFYCVDDDGKLLIDPNGAEIITRHVTNQRKGKLNYRETRLQIGDSLYALGYAKAHPPNFDSLEIRQNTDEMLKDFPFILSNYSEREVMLGIARRGLVILNFALAFIVLAGLLAVGGIGSFSASSYLAAALIAPGYLLFLFGLLMYNDLVFLRQRVSATRSNIDVALKKRFDLLPNVEAVVKTYMAHETALFQRIAELRTQAAGGGLEQPVLADLVVRSENYPDLKADSSAAHLMQTIVQVENEIALMRSGFNQAVERYNTRIGHIPEVFLAILFRFKSESLFAADFTVREVPTVEFGPTTTAPADAPADAR